MTTEGHTVNVPLLMTIEEAAKRMSISRGMVYKLIRQKKLRAVKIGATTRIRLEDLNQYINNL